MSPEKQRIAIAEACGWEPEIRARYAGERKVKGWGFNTHLSLGDANRKFEMTPHSFPDYLNDLNAMHGAVMAQPLNVRVKVRMELQYLIAPHTRPGKRHGVCVMNHEEYDAWVNATAAQRAEAFLRTLGKWEET